MTKKNFYNGCYGEQATITEIQQMILRIHESNSKSNTKTALCIWGIPGIGKTSLVKELSTLPIKFNNKDYTGFDIVDIPLAQNEEMGDLQGIPETFITMTKGDLKIEVVLKEVIVDYYIKKGYELTTESVTRNIPPKWVPTEKRPGIILFDDANRASSRITKGIMQLIQDYKTISWGIPDGYTIVLTGNPDNADFEVTSFDSAMITRLTHVTLKPDIKVWLQWACQKNDIDSRGTSWLSKYGMEYFINNNNSDTRTNFRTFTSFCRTLKRYPNLNDANQLRNFYIDANGIIDSDITNSFMTFLEKDMDLFYSPEEILEGKVDYKKFGSTMGQSIDSIYIICYRLVQYIISDNYKFQQSHVKGFQNFIEMDVIPIDTKTVILNQFITIDPDTHKPTINENVRYLLVGSPKIKDCYCKLLETYKCSIKQ